MFKRYSYTHLHLWQIMDTASVLQIKSGLELISQQLNAVRDILVRLSSQYRDAPMAGRTHLQHALPITFGYKCAVWLSALDRHAERLEQLRPRALLVQFGGAVGSLASLGTNDIGLKVRAKLAEDLGLHDPPISWHVARDGIAETISFLSVRPSSCISIPHLFLRSSEELSEKSLMIYSFSALPNLERSKNHSSPIAGHHPRCPKSETVYHQR